MLKRDPPILPDHASCETLTGLTYDHLPRDGSVGRPRRFRQGAYLWRAEDPPDCIYVLERGQASIMASDREGHEIILSVVEAGEPLGILCYCALRNQRRDTVARAIVDSVAVEVHYQEFAEFLRANADAFDAFLVTFCVLLSDAEQRIRVLAHRSAEHRLGNLLWQLAHRKHERGEAPNGRAVLHVSHDGLAQMAAMSRPHVTVTMGRLRQLGLVTYGRNRPLVVDVAGLAAHLDGAATEPPAPTTTGDGARTGRRAR